MTIAGHTSHLTLLNAAQQQNPTQDYELKAAIRALEKEVEEQDSYAQTVGMEEKALGMKEIRKMVAEQGTAIIGRRKYLLSLNAAQADAKERAQG